MTNLLGEVSFIDYPLNMSNAGDGAYPYTPGLGFGTGSGFELVPYLVLGDHRHAYVWFNAEGEVQTLFTQDVVSLFSDDSFRLDPGETVKNVTWFGVSSNGASGARAIYEEVHTPAEVQHQVSGQVKLPDTARWQDTWVVARHGAEMVALVPVGPEGGFTFRADAGELTLQSYAREHAASPTVVAAVSADVTDVALEIPQAATLNVDVRDSGSGASIGGRVTFIRKGDTPSAYPPAEARPGHKTWTGTISAIAYTTGGPEPVVLPAGTYEVTATRGFSYEYAQRELVVAPGANPDEIFTLIRAVDTTGWLSSDFHIHALWSPDSFVPYEIRIKQAIAEDLDLPILTEHVYAEGFGRRAKELGLDDQVIGITGQEVTTFAFWHFNAFPLVWDPTRPNNGAVFPYDKTAPGLFQAIRDQNPNDVVIAVNHPRGAALGSYFTYAGLDAAANTVENTEGWSTNWEAIEVFNGNCHGSSNLETLADWVGLTNHGHRKTLASGSDVHGESGIPGYPRNWIQVDEADVRADHFNLVPAVRSRRLFVSCGPFVRFHAIGPEGEKIGLGGLAPVNADGEVTFRVVVEAPTWIGVKSVRLWENGVTIDEIDATQATDPVIRVDQALTVKPAADAWYAIEVIGSGTLYPVRSDTPYALTNPIEVDADGDGDWTPPGTPSP